MRTFNWIRRDYHHWIKIQIILAFPWSHHNRRHTTVYFLAYTLNQATNYLTTAVMPPSHDRMFSCVHVRLRTRRVSEVHVLQTLRSRSSAFSEVIKAFTVVRTRFKYIWIGKLPHRQVVPRKIHSPFNTSLCLHTHTRTMHDLSVYVFECVYVCVKKCGVFMYASKHNNQSLYTSSARNEMKWKRNDKSR